MKRTADPVSERPHKALSQAPPLAAVHRRGRSTRAHGGSAGLLPCAHARAAQPAYTRRGANQLQRNGRGYRHGYGHVARLQTATKQVCGEEKLSAFSSTNALKGGL